MTDPLRRAFVRAAVAELMPEARSLLAEVLAEAENAERQSWLQPIAEKTPRESSGKRAG
jgi:hypothetical protein